MATDSAISTKVDNGQLTITVHGFAPIVIDPADYPAELVNYAALHGFKQKYVDGAALGKGATLTEKHAAIMAIVEHHQTTGEWNRVGGGDGTSGDGLLVRALMEAAGLGRDEARTAVGQMDKATQAAMRKDAEIAPIIARIKLEKPLPKASATVDTGSLLAKLRAA